MADPRDPLTQTEKLIFGHDAVRDPVTGNVFEQGEKALPREVQAKHFAIARDTAADMPKQGECCPQTGREYECGSGAATKQQQSANFVNELPPEAKAQRLANAAALNAMPSAGSA